MLHAHLSELFLLDSVLLFAEMDGDKDGKIKGKFPVFNDLLAFLWSKMNVSPRDTLLNVLKTFYKDDDIVKARDLLFRTLPDTSFRKIKHRKAENIFKGMYDPRKEAPRARKKSPLHKLEL